MVAPTNVIGLWILVLEFLLGYLDMVLGHAAQFNAQLTWIGYGYFGLLAFLLALTFWYNHGSFPSRRRLWERSFMCRHCSYIFQLRESNEHTCQAFIGKTQR